MLLGSALFAVIVVAGENVREPVPGGFYERRGCAEVPWPKLSRVEEAKASRFEEYDGAFETMAFECAVALYLDLRDVSSDQKFEHFASQARRSEQWGAALVPYLADLDWQRFLNYVYRRAGALGPDEWVAVGRATAFRHEDSTHRKESYPVVNEPPAKLAQLFFEQAQHSKDPGARALMANWFAKPWATIEQALTLAGRLPKEDEPSTRTAILRVQLTHNDPRTNKVVRDFLRGPLELKVLEYLCEVYPKPLIEENRYDFLPDLRALRARLVAEKDMRKTYEARQGIQFLDEVLPALEKKKQENAPICPSRKSRK